MFSRVPRDGDAAVRYPPAPRFWKSFVGVTIVDEDCEGGSCFDPVWPRLPNLRASDKRVSAHPGGLLEVVKTTPHKTIFAV